MSKHRYINGLSEVDNSLEYIQTIEPVGPESVYEAVEINYDASISRTSYFTDYKLIHWLTR